MKAGIVSRDETEEGERALLNLGHTFCHALEKATGYSSRLLHGEGVAIGCALAFELSQRLGLCSQEAPSRVRAHLRAMGMKVDLADIPGELPDESAPPAFRVRLPAIAVLPESVPPELTMTLPATEPLTFRLPPLTVVRPVWARLPVESVPVPAFVKPPLPAVVPVNAVEPLLPPAVSVLAASATEPAPARLPIVSLAPSESVAPEATVTALASPMAEPPDVASVPVLIVVAPE